MRKGLPDNKLLSIAILEYVQKPLDFGEPQLALAFRGNQSGLLGSSQRLEQAM